MIQSPLKIVKNQTIIFPKLILIIDKNIRKIKEKKKEKNRKAMEGRRRRRGEEELEEYQQNQNHSKLLIPL